VTALLRPLIIPNHLPLFVLAVVAAAYYGGTGAGLLATALSTASSYYFLVSSLDPFTGGPRPVTRLGFLSWSRY
jgi:hypothetical protein